MFERICLTVQINNFLSYTTVITKYNIQTNYLEYCKVVSAPVKHLRKKMLLQSKPHSLGKKQ